MCYHWVHEPSLTLGNMLGFMAEESLCLPKAETAPQRTVLLYVCQALAFPECSHLLGPEESGFYSFLYLL